MNGLLLALMMAGGINPPEPPPVSLEDIARFPSQSTVHETLKFIQAHRDWLDQQKPLTLEDAGNLDARKADMYWRWYIWDDLKIIHATDSPEMKLIVLKRLRDWIEPEHYDRGELPPPVPIWLFPIYGD